LFGCGYLTTLTGKKEEGHDVSSFINGRGGLRVVAAFGEHNGLIPRFSDRTLASLVDADAGTVDEPDLVFQFSRQACAKF
jgi:hypothetical protein